MGNTESENVQKENEENNKENEVNKNNESDKNNENNKNNENIKNNQNDESDKKVEKEIDINSLPEYTMDEIEKHDSKDNGVWIVLNNLVYDVTPFLPNHPGGPGFLLEVAGEDATSEFEAAIHSHSARERSKQYIIGKVKYDKNKKKGLGIPTSLNPTMNLPTV